MFRQTCPVALALTLVACSASQPVTPPDEPAPAPAKASASPQSGCGDYAFVVNADAASVKGPRATLVVERKGEGMPSKERATCIEVGGETVIAAPGERVEVAIAAHAQQLQRLRIGGRLVLVPIAPGGRIRLADQPCFGWALSAPWLDPFAVGSDHAYCRADGATCREGYTQVGPPGPVSEPLCETHSDEDSSRRCVRNAAVRFVGAANTNLRLFRFGDESGEPIALGAGPAARELSPTAMPAHCGEPEVATASERVMLILSAGSRVDVGVAASGRVEARLR